MASGGNNPTSTIIDDRDANVTYWTPTGAEWTVHTNVGSIYHLNGASDTFTDVQGATATLRFYGTAVEYWGNQGPYHGPCDITLDGQQVATVNSHAAADDVPILLYSTDHLGLGDHTLVVTVKDPSYPNVCEIDKFVVNTASNNNNGGGHVAGTTTVYAGPSGTSSPNNGGGSNNKKGSFPVAAVAGAVGGAAAIAIVILWWWWIRKGDKAKKARRNSTPPKPKAKLKTTGPGNVTPLLADEPSSPLPRDVEKGGYSRPGPISNAPSSYQSSSPPPSSYTPSSAPPSTIHNLGQYPQHPYNNAAVNPIPRPLSSVSNTDTSYFTNMTAATTEGYPQNQQPFQPYQQQPQQQPVAAIAPVWAIPASTSPQPSLQQQQMHSVAPSPSQSPAPVPAVLPALAPVQHQAPSPPPSNASTQYPPEKAVYRGSQAPSEKARYMGPHSQGPSSAGSGSGSVAPTSTAGAGSSAASPTATSAASTTPAQTNLHDVITPDIPPPAYQM